MELPSEGAKCGWHTCLEYRALFYCYVTLSCSSYTHIVLKFSRKMPFPFGQYFGRCHILRRRKYSVESDGVERGGGGGGGCFIMSVV